MIMHRRASVVTAAMIALRATLGPIVFIIYSGGPILSIIYSGSPIVSIIYSGGPSVYQSF